MFYGLTGVIDIMMWLNVSKKTFDMHVFCCLEKYNIKLKTVKSCGTASLSLFVDKESDISNLINTRISQKVMQFFFVTLQIQNTTKQILHQN